MLLGHVFLSFVILSIAGDFAVLSSLFIYYSLIR